MNERTSERMHERANEGTDEATRERRNERARTLANDRLENLRVSLLVVRTRNIEGCREHQNGTNEGTNE